ncbi:endonuclease/exonuclease/phosphatase family protein [Flavobacteriaceae bacterium F89]|uniref:Endonuclease/exonuclease/phosphatase family protein n=1 Tax=Cerina litoralis TaxID=2874477 RepID=A0AAE3EU35_9FLAO|nr:endonuclease/exonuclease/phosphatase family protein [Cerina litoralis]MCG2460134.1 endonuclease/exonuclease/phosphatase family protein [Cerina litoralis]
MKLRQFFILVLISQLSVYSQRGETFEVRTIAFYNVENLFDTINDPKTFDDDRTPSGKDQWNSERYHQKIANISKVISVIGSETTHTSPDIIGLSEVENQQVLEDLISHPNLREMGYGIVHFESPDERGIDVALLYKKAIFLPSTYKSRRLILKKEDGERDYTRDQLVVNGFLDNEQFYFIVNHWPSRSGGAARSKPNRVAAAQLNKQIMDSIYRSDASARIISMGDLNDDPIDDSLKKTLETKSDKDALAPHELYNPMEALYRKGVGTLAYRDHWNLFDQIFFTGNLVFAPEQNFRFWKVGVYRPPYLIIQKGAYKGYPYRTYANGNYTGGYSDHFPAYIYLIRKESPPPGPR